MKKFVSFASIAIAFMMVASCSQNKYETVAGDPLNTQMYTLKNGLKVYMSVNKETPRIKTYIAVRVGGKNDPAETTGLAHYFEHLMFKGTEQFGTSDYQAEKPLLDQIESLFETYRRTEDEKERTAIYHTIDSLSYEASKYSIPNEYDKLMAIIGAEGTNAFTSQDMTVYEEDIPSNQIDNWARIQADRFKNPVIRGFHTELETIYEEKNMSLTQDNRKVYESLDAALFPHHPYGTQTVLGTQEHLKNPSITNVKNYHKTYYVPNNMAICVSGDFNPDEMVATIEKYFGDMVPNPNIPELKYEKEQPITSPIVKEVYGLEAENITLGWRLPGATDKDAGIYDLVSFVLYNGQAGLIDLNINQQQKTLDTYGYVSSQPDYGSFVISSKPKTGQTLDEVRDILLAEVDKLRKGEFDENLVEASKNNIKKYFMQSLEDNDSRAEYYVNSFINGSEWANDVKSFKAIDNYTKQDIVDFANKYLTENGYVAIYKRQGEDKTVQKIAAPKITPIMTNRDEQSDFLKEIQSVQVKPIEPVFIDYNKDMSIAKTGKGLELLYKQNTSNDLFQLHYIFNSGTENDPLLNTAFTYLSYLGTDQKTPEEIASELYGIACSFNMRSSANGTYITISGLSENMEKAMNILEDLIYNSKADEDILANIKTDILQDRANAKLNQGSCFGALRRYIYYGPEFIRKNTLSNEQIKAVTSDELLQKTRSFIDKEHEILYYGPMKMDEVIAALDKNHKTADKLIPLEKKFTKQQITGESNVYLAQYDAKQLYYLQYSNNGDTFNPSLTPEIELYNEYFGGGMNGIVFQEMREARGLAYSSVAYMINPVYKNDTYTYFAFIATQNDKMKQAIQAFDEIINNMPESEAAFKVTKESLINRLRTKRTIRESVLLNYLDDRDLGLTEPQDKLVFEKVQNMTLKDVKATQEKYVKGRKYNYGILGDIKDLDMNYLKTLGKVTVLSSEDIFGY